MAAVQLGQAEHQLAQAEYERRVKRLAWVDHIHIHKAGPAGPSGHTELFESYFDVIGSHRKIAVE